MLEIADKTQQWRAMALPVKLLAGTAARSGDGSQRVIDMLVVAGIAFRAE